MKEILLVVLGFFLGSIPNIIKGVKEKRRKNIKNKKLNNGELKLIDSFPHDMEIISLDEVKKIFLKFNNPINEKSLKYIKNLHTINNTHIQWSVSDYVQLEEDGTKIIWKTNERRLGDRKLFCTLENNYPCFEIQVGSESNHIEDVHGNLLPHKKIKVIINDTNEYDKNFKQKELVEKLSKEAIVILTEAKEDTSGVILLTSYLSGTVLEINGKKLIDTLEREEIAKWENAIKELEENEYIIDKNGEGEMFFITTVGYNLIDSFMNS